ncbi:MAG: phospho-sugar mutase [Cyclobacteriaceae bacterium]|jgi:phosphoglucomutase|nr:phospho-sugar mutase [Cyclobacteriaceae bacterium]
MATTVQEEVMQKAQKWLDSPLVDDDTKREIRDLMSSPDSKVLIDSFYKDLEFGTGGLRGIMGPGSNCVNQYTIGMATQGFANYLLKSFSGQPVTVAIAYDSRNNSSQLAQIAANVLSANGIHVKLFSELRPTPMLSFAIRYLRCQGGIVITASHNPKEYNGYKVYWSDGAQVVPPHDGNIIREVKAITDFSQVKFDPVPENIKPISSEVEDAYYEEVLKLIPNRDAIKRQHDIPLVYSSLHGAGITMVPECLRRVGFTNVHIVEEQRQPDGNFPTVKSPNPEEKSAMEMALAKGQAVNATIVMATDPDTDRVGIGVRNNAGEFVLLDGNQAFSLLMQFLLKHASKASGYIAKTIVTTELVDTMAARHGIPCYNTLTGFKYIAELMGKLEGKEQFIAAGEESYGYMVGDFVRDKDAVSACAFFAAIAASAADEGKSMYDSLIDMYVEFGMYQERLITLTRTGREGEQAIRTMMENFRSRAPERIAGQRVVRALDYKTGVEVNLETGKESALTLPKSDVLQFYLEDGSKISVRPSGTEPKIKFYISVNTPLASAEAYEQTRQALQERIDRIEEALLG